MRLELTLKNMLDKIESLDWKWDVYIPSNKEINDSILCLVLDDDTEEDRGIDDEPIYPTSIGYKSFLSVSDLQSIKSNLLQQNSEAGLNELISAAKYYYENDAFININR
ncbi:MULTISPECIES: hypothetical protein [unclassified Shewanella]|uniref:DUF7716 domain-containing protein n=1 Tax=unclassified Shewanella TaxID=196818 RepID=UPI0021DA1F23|nr:MULTISPECIES: hypothetical protein [unclassified Shewanella]MCU8062402.1 hypothetical protein [Shewanella sp. SM55]MCU8070969.1 hypothetical protein [Shewanella sp. SM32]MCU8089161.1 hypothetical protein [Shewanella sp. SM21]